MRASDDVGAAGDVFLVPEQVVVLVLLADDGEQVGVGVVGLALVPADDGLAVQLGDWSERALRWIEVAWVRGS